ncbi:hypothetical protein T12_4747 [Trichinella patagoniensis]|uniref:Uncharacterized protein n=1 Tax=Trichinella patagoniensis TaxID=990121 RepID=A0A0V0ZXH4_9BILA|nr:hypothetical protein T12_4747 [Trichinella patagoniensis]
MGAWLLCQDRPCSTRLACPSPFLDVFPLLGPVVSMPYLFQRLRHAQVGPRLPVVDGGQDLRDPLPRYDLQQPCLARIRGLPLPAYGPLMHDYPFAL